MKIKLNNLKNKKLLIAVKEAGAGSLLAALLKELNPIHGSLVLASKVASKYFHDIQIMTDVVDENFNYDFNNIIKSVSPDYVLVGASANESVEKKIILASQKLNLKVISFIDHYSNLWQRFAHEKSANKWFYKPNFIFVIDKICKEKLISLGWPKQNIGVNPHPLIKRNNYRKKIDKKNILNKINLPENAKVITFVSEYNFRKSDTWKWEQSSDNDKEIILKFIIDYLFIQNKKSILKTYLIIKLHPNETRFNSSLYKNFSSKHTRILKNELDKESFLRISDLVVGLNSMLLLEASSFGLPVFSYPGSLQNTAVKLHEINKNIILIDDINSFKFKMDNLIKN